MGGCSGPELAERSETPAGGAAAAEIHAEQLASQHRPEEELDGQSE